jgi:hypothetical protein
MSSFDSAVSIANAGESADSAIDAKVSATGRYAFALTSDIDGPSSQDEMLKAVLSFRVMFTVDADDPVNNVVYSLSILTTNRGVYANGPDGAMTSNRYDYGDVSIALNGDERNTGHGSGFGGGLGGGISPMPVLQYSATSGTGMGANTYVADFTWTFQTKTTPSNAGGSEIAILAGLDGSNPLMSSLQRYPIGDHSDPLEDGIFFTLTAEIIAVPEPQTLALAFSGLLLLLWQARRTGWPVAVTRDTL